MLRLLWISTSMFLSVLMGAAAFAALAMYWPGALHTMVEWGKVLEDEIYHLDALSEQVRFFLDFLIDGNQFVFLALVIISRILLSLLGMVFSRD